MFAKLNFSTAITAAQVVRDVTRIIHDSSSGSASLNNLEFINVLDSELYAGVNSGWSLAGGVTLPTGVVDSTDVYRVLQSPCVNSSKIKYASIQVNCDWSNSSYYNATSCGWMMVPVLDYGTATELFLGGYTGGDTNRRRRRVFAPSGDIYIFASPRRLIIFASEAIDTNQQILNAYMEFAENGMSTFYNTVPAAYFALLLNYDQLGEWSNQQAWRRGTPSWNNYDAAQSNNLVFPKSLYDHSGKGLGRIASIVYRRLGFESGTNVLYWTSETGTTNGTDFGSLATESNLAAAYGGSAIHMIGTCHAVQHYGPDLWSTNGRHANYGFWTDQYTQAGKYISAAGVRTVPLTPIAVNVYPASSGLIDFSICDTYITTGQLGIMGDTITIGGDVYYYFTRSGDGSAWAIKKI
jgi:hypothetical protein